MSQRASFRLPTRSQLCCALALAVMSSGTVMAQSTAATLRGQATANAEVTATNVATGVSRSTTAREDGSYSLAGLPPGTYRVTGGGAAQEVTLLIGENATLDLDSTVTTLETVNVVGALVPMEMRTSEVSSYVSTQQIEALPQASRNILAYADIVPGVQFVRNNNGETQLRSGAQSANAVNVFIDGVGQKNYVLQGGVTGQDTSSGNPFPQLAISEFKVITQNYKAEFDQLGSAAIVAQTRSGSNTFTGSAFYDITRTGWRSANEFEQRDDTKAESGEVQYGVGFGGPIVQDVAHYFFTYERKEFDRPRDIIPGQGRTADDLPADFRTLIGPYTVPFTEDLYFGKASWAVNNDHYLELTARRRSESELTSIGGANTAEFGTRKDNNETRFSLRHQFTHGDWFNEAQLTWEDVTFNPRPVQLAPGYLLTTGNWTEVILARGGGPDFQEKGQKGWGLQNDLRFDGWAGHALKFGVKFKAVELHTTEQQPYNPQFHYDIGQDLTTPFSVRFGAGLSGVGDGSLQARARQFGIYLQDDWSVTDRLTLNLGLRWDYETNPAYTDYDTPADVIAALNAVDPRGNGTQTYAQSLALGGIDINQYISNGSQRDDFKSAWQPRLGFSYDFRGDDTLVLFGGAGRSYDRNLFDRLQVEATKATFPSYQFFFNVAGHPCTVGTGNCLAWDPAYYDPAQLRALVAGQGGAGREINMVHNDLKTPYSDQFSLGLRSVNTLGAHTWTSSLTLSHVASHDGLVFLLGNRLPSGDFFAPGTTWGAPWGAGVPGYGALLLGMNGLETRANSLLLSIEKPFTRDSRWGTTFAYTYTDAKENRQFGEHYALDYPTMDDYGWRQAGGVSKHRLVSTGIFSPMEDFTLSAKLTLATPVPRYGVNCLPGWSDCLIDQYTPDTTLGERRLDLAVEKSFPIGETMKLRLRADLLNAFNWTNYTGYDDWWGAPNDPSATWGEPTAASYTTRQWKLTLGLNW